MRLGGALAGALILGWGSAAVAQGPVPTPPVAAQSAASEVAPSAPCELHAWPSRDFHTTYYGWAHGGTTDASLTRPAEPGQVGVPMANSGQPGPRKGYPPVAFDTLTAARQTQVLRQADLAGALGLAGYRVVVHDEPLTTRAVRATVGRHAEQSAACTVELLVEGITLQADFATGKFLNVLYRLRRFRQGDAPDLTFGTFVTARVAVPLSGRDTAPPEALAAKAAQAFAASIGSFGTAARAAIARADRAQTSSPRKGK